MTNIDPVLEKIRREDLRYEEIEPGFWTMSSHKWALLAWASARLGTPATLVHLDWHWDGINDFRGQEQLNVLANLKSLEDLREIIADPEKLVCYASFIAPGVIMDLVDEVHFYCLQADTTPGLDDDLLEQNDAVQFMHGSLDELLSAVSDNQKPLFFDLDIDLFNRATPYFGEGNEHIDRIESFLSSCSGLIQEAAVITIAQSPANYWIQEEGHFDWDDELSVRLMNHIVPFVRRLKNDAS